MTKPTNIVLQRLSLTPAQLDSALAEFLDAYVNYDAHGVEEHEVFPAVDLFSQAVMEVYAQQQLVVELEEAVNQPANVPTDPPTTVQGDPAPTPEPAPEPEPPTTVQGEGEDPNNLGPL